MRLNEKEGQLGSQKENVYRNSVGVFLWGLEDQCVFVRAPEHKSSVQGKSEAPGLFVKNKCGTGGRGHTAEIRFCFLRPDKRNVAMWES